MDKLRTEIDNPLDGRSPNTGIFGGDFNQLIGQLFDGFWGIALFAVAAAWIAAVVYFAVKTKSNPGQAGSAKGWLIAASVAVVLIAGARVFLGGAIAAAS